MQSLRDLIRENWEGKKFIKIGCNKSLTEQIKEQTKFLDKHYSSLLNKQRAFFILNDFGEDDIPLCICGCGRRVEVNVIAEKGFRKYYSEECHRHALKISKEALRKLSNRDWLYNERVVLKKAIETIGLELGVSHPTVDGWLKKHGIKNLTDARRRNQVAADILNDKEKLNALYSSGLTCRQIAEQLNTTCGTVSKWLIYHDIDRRPSNSYDRKINKISGEEKELIHFISEVYAGELKTSNRSILNGRELDIYIPELKIAIEYDGLYSHSYKPWEERECLIKGPKYHLSKTLDCEKQGIQLIHIFSDEWNYRNEIVKSILKSKLRLNERIFARKCSVVEVSVDVKNRFLNMNHIQGEDKSKIKLGLEYNGVLVCLMTFNKSRFNKKYEWELVRFSNALGLSAVGGFSKLLSYFRARFPGSIVSYADRRYSTGNVILRMGLS
jgi:transposase-like protein